MMLPKLAIGNVRKSIRDYTIYFLTIVFGVCIFYVFNSIESQQAIMQASESQRTALSLLSKFMNVFSVFISAALCFLIIYANNFLIKRRKKEFGIYMILGMEKGAISQILVIETVLVGLAGLFVGLLLGVFVSQGMALVTAHLLNSTIEGYHFVFSVSAVVKTFIYFGLTFFLTLVFNVLTIGRQRLIDLLSSAHKNESFTPPNLGRSIAFFILSVALIGGAYFLLTREGGINNQAFFLAAVVLAIAGTFLFFFSLSGFLLKLIQQRKNLYLRNLNMFVVRQINSKIHTNYVSMTFVCLMLSLGICALSSGIGVATTVSGMLAENAPFDATVEMQHVAPGEDGGLVPHAQLDVPGILKTQDVDLDSLAGSYAVLSQHKSPVSLTMRNPDGEPVNLEPRVMTLSDYNASLALQGKEPLALDEGSFALHTNKPKDALKDMLDAYLATEPSIEFGSATLRSSPSLLCTDIVETSSARAERVDIIVADTHVPATGDNALPVLRTLLNINYPQGSKNTTAFDGALTGTFYERGVRSTDDVVLNCWVETRTSVLQVGSSATTITAYIALYLGVVFLIASAALLAIAQLSEASDNVERYRMLSKIGTDEKMLRGALLSQIAIYFGTPLVLALVHAFIGILALSETLAAIKGMQILSGSLIAALIVVAVYGGYFLATYLGSKSILNREVINRLAQE